MSFFTFTQACRSCNAQWLASFGIVGTAQIGDSRKTCPKCGDDAVYTVPATSPSPSQPTTVVRVPVPEGNESRYVKVLREQSVASPSQPVAAPTNPVYLELRQIYCCKGAEFCRPTLEKAWKEIERLSGYTASLEARHRKELAAVHESCVRAMPCSECRRLILKALEVKP